MGHNLHSTIQYHQYQICVKAKLWCIFELLSLDRLGSMHLRNLLTLLETGRRPPNDKISGLTTIYHSRNLDPSLPILQLSGKTHKTLQDISVLEIVCEAEVLASSWAILTFLTFWTYCASKASCILLPDWFIDVHCYSEYSGRFVVLSHILVGCFCMFLWSLSGWRFTWGHWEFGADGDQALWCQHPKFGEGRGCWSATIEKTE